MANHGRACVLAVVLTLTWIGTLRRAADDSEVREDCLGFNLDSASVALIQKSWKIVDGGQRMFDFGNQEQQARRALDIIHYYRMDSTCFAGRPHPPMVYLLASGKVPEGSMPGEQCESFDAAGISLSQYGEFWRILSGAQVLFDFGNRERGQGKDSLRSGITDLSISASLALRAFHFDICGVDGASGTHRYTISDRIAPDRGPEALPGN